MKTGDSKAGESQLYRRTLGVTIIGYIFMLFGLSGIIFSLISMSVLFDAFPLPSPAAPATDGEQLAHWIFTKIAIVGGTIVFSALIFTFAISILTILCGLGLVRRMKWSRPTGLVLAFLCGPIVIIFLCLGELWIASGTVFAITIGVLIVLFLHPYEFMTEKIQGLQAKK